MSQTLRQRRLLRQAGRVYCDPRLPTEQQFLLQLRGRRLPRVPRQIVMMIVLSAVATAVALGASALLSGGAL